MPMQGATGAMYEQRIRELEARVGRLDRELSTALEALRHARENENVAAVEAAERQIRSAQDERGHVEGRLRAALQEIDSLRERLQASDHALEEVAHRRVQDSNVLQEREAKIRELERELEYQEEPDVVAHGAPRGTRDFHVGQATGDWHPLERLIDTMADSGRIYAIEVRRIPRHGGMTSDVFQARRIVRRAENDAEHDSDAGRDAEPPSRPPGLVPSRLDHRGGNATRRMLQRVSVRPDESRAESWHVLIDGRQIRRLPDRALGLRSATRLANAVAESLASGWDPEFDDDATPERS